MSLVVNIPRGPDRSISAVARRTRVAFFGTPTFAVPSLRRLVADGWPVDLVVTSPDKATGRMRTLTASPVRAAADELGIAVMTPATLKDKGFLASFAEARPDVCIVVAYGKLIPVGLLAVPRLGWLNVHPSLLPAYRGPSPIQTAILDGCASSGVSVMLLDAEMDHGPVLAAEPWVIPSGFDYPACESELADIGASLLVRSLKGFTDGSLTALPQDHALATYTRKFSRADGRLDWSRPADTIVNRVRALTPNPGAWTTWNGKILNILSARLEGGNAVPELVQLEGGRPMPWDEFRRGHSGPLI